MLTRLSKRSAKPKRLGCWADMLRFTQVNCGSSRLPREKEEQTMTMRGVALKNAGYLLSLLPQVLLVLGTYLHFPWLSVLFFFAALPLLRHFIGNDMSPAIQSPSRWMVLYLNSVPRLYCLTWALVVPWVVWTLATKTMTIPGYIGFTLSLWIVCSLNTAVAHELIHAASSVDRKLGGLLDASIGYFHFAEEHLSHHARTGHYYGGDAAIPGTSIYSFVVRRYRDSLATAWQFEVSRLKRMNLSWRSNRLLRKAPIPLAIATGFFLFAGSTGLGIYLFQVAGTAFTIQAITYLQHWGLSERETPELRDFGFAWEDGCWIQACVTLNHAYHGRHHLNLRRPYYQLAWAKDSLSLPASYPVMFIVALFPAFFTRVMRCRLTRWIEDFDQRDERWHNTDCIGVARKAPALRHPSAEEHENLPAEGVNDSATSCNPSRVRPSRSVSDGEPISN